MWMLHPIGLLNPSTLQSPHNPHCLIWRFNCGCTCRQRTSRTGRQEHSTQRWAHHQRTQRCCLLSQCSSVTETNLHEGDGHFLHTQVSSEQGTVSQPSVPACAWLSLSRMSHYRLFVTSCLDTTLTVLGNLPALLTR